MKTARDIANAPAQGGATGLGDEEPAFHDVLTRLEAVKDFYENEDLAAITRELIDMPRKNRTTAWRKKSRLGQKCGAW